jgi:hypothetical protein
MNSIIVELLHCFVPRVHGTVLKFTGELSSPLCRCILQIFAISEGELEDQWSNLDSSLPVALKTRQRQNKDKTAKLDLTVMTIVGDGKTDFL